jgi:hypothetical protein
MMPRIIGRPHGPWVSLCKSVVTGEEAARAHLYACVFNPTNKKAPDCGALQQHLTGCLKTIF